MSEIKNYFSKSSKTIESLNNFEEKIVFISDTIYQAYKKDKKILVAGNFVSHISSKFTSSVHSME